MEPFNLKGYVCLGQSLIWGVGSIFVIYILQPFVDNFINIMSGDVGKVVLLFALIVFISDIIITVTALFKVKKYSRVLDEVGDRIKSLSDSVGKNISDGAINAMKFGDKNMQELENLKEKYQVISNKYIFGYRRLTKAFPSLRPIKIKKVKK